MKNYSGHTTFNFEIERYKNKKTGEYYHGSKDPDNSDDNFELQTINLEVSGSSYFAPGRYSGAPEDCYPDESDTEIHSVIGPDGKDWYDHLSTSEVDEIISNLSENVQSSGYDDYDGPDEDDYDPSWDYT